MAYALRFPRFAAWVVDVLLLVVALAILNGLGVLDTFVVEGEQVGPLLSPEVGVLDTFVVEEGETVSTLHAVMQGLLVLGYFTVPTAIWGATPAKMALNIRVVDGTGRKPRPMAVLLREWMGGGVAPLPAVVLGQNEGLGITLLIMLVVAFWVLLDDHRQGLHDKAAGTFVVQT